jgi:type I restriction enzyme S subunit
MLETIAAEKGRQIASGRIKPDKPLTAPLDERPFEIPETWAWVPMGEVVEIVRGITFPASEKTKEAAPGRIACLRTANIQELSSGTTFCS